jgi:hypothetical protein
MSALKQPNGPQTHPWVQMYQWLTNPLEYIEDCAKRYGCDSFRDTVYYKRVIGDKLSRVV